MYTSFLAVFFGGSLGCIVRWILGLKLNALFPNLPLGTLIVNLVGGFIIGIAMFFFIRFPNLDPAWRLLITTGFCGGLTTFSTFSAEVLYMLQHGRLEWAAITIVTHVAGSLVMTFLGYLMMQKFSGG